MSEEGKDGKWLANLYNSLISGAETKPLENYYQVSEQSDYSISELLPSKEVGDKHYAAAIGKLEDSIELEQLSTLKAIVLPQKYTIVVHFLMPTSLARRLGCRIFLHSCELKGMQKAVI